MLKSINEIGELKMSNGSFFDEYSKIVGYKIVGIAQDDSDPDDIWEGLVLLKGTKRKIAWIQRDPEGNGSGFLSIEDKIVE
jgi:hypothetical protein